MGGFGLSERASTRRRGRAGIHVHVDVKTATFNPSPPVEVFAGIAANLGVFQGPGFRSRRCRSAARPVADLPKRSKDSHGTPSLPSPEAIARPVRVVSRASSGLCRVPPLVAAYLSGLAARFREDRQVTRAAFGVRPPSNPPARKTSKQSIPLLAGQASRIAFSASSAPW
jgi:hypothetical protein